VLWQELNVGRSKVLIAIEIGESQCCHRPGCGKVLGLRVQGQTAAVLLKGIINLIRLCNLIRFPTLAIVEYF
jgi:hypothetical protein